VNFEELESKLKEALVELSSGQLIIKFLQKQPNTTLVLGSQYNLRYEMPLLHKEVVNLQPLSITHEHSKLMDPNQLNIILKQRDMQNTGIRWPANIEIFKLHRAVNQFQCQMETRKLPN
jgi:hypothetical protein